MGVGLLEVSPRTSFRVGDRVRCPPAGFTRILPGRFCEGVVSDVYEQGALVEFRTVAFAVTYGIYGFEQLEPWS